MKNTKIINVLAILATFFVGVNLAFAEVINNIDVKGNSRMSSVAIKSAISYRVGDDITQDQEQEIIQELYNTGSFKDVSVNFSAGNLVINVKENPIFNDFTFKGNDKIKTTDLLKAVGVKVRTVYSKRAEKIALSNIRQIYKSRGYYSANISVKKVAKANNRINLEFTIDEGKLATVKKIKFNGNKTFSDSSLKDVILSKEDAWFRFLSDDDIYDKGRIAVDKQELKNFYRNRGFADIKIGDVNAELSKDKKDFFLTYNIREGKRYKLGKISIKNWPYGVDKKAVKKKIEGGDRAGYFYAKGLNEIMVDITKELNVQGISFIELDPKLKRYTGEDGKNYIDVTFVMKKSKKIFVEKIVVRGNTRTLDRVIRKEIEVVEGDPFNPALMRESESNVRKLGFFSDVKISFAEGSSANKAIVYIDVKEKTTGSAGIGVGYSTTAGMVFKVTVSEDNFLGRGQRVKASLFKQDKDLGGEFSFTEPYFMKRDVAATMSVSKTKIDRLKNFSYKAKSTSFGLNFSYDLNRKWSQSLGVSYRDYDLYEVSSGASLSVQDEKGRTKGYSLLHRLTYSDVDDYFNPTEGYKVSLTTNLKSISTKFKHHYLDLRGSYYHPLNEKVKVILTGSVTRIGGYNQLRFADRLYLNSDYILGFDKVGPMDKTSGDLLGGTKRMVGTAELDFPVGLPASMGVKGSVFYSIAKLGGTPKRTSLTIVGDNAVRQVVGAGIKWASPIGPMRFDFTKVLKKGPMDQARGFQFTIGFGLN
ncbi:MAG: outer membrane protein assembly factor BamA [Alphaproteobacteria bacterium]